MPGGGSFDESLHPRASDGKFGVGAGGGAKAPTKQGPSKTKSTAQTAAAKAKLATARVAAKEKATAIVAKAKERAKAIVEKAKARQPAARPGKAPTKEAKAKVAAARAAAKEKARAIVAKAKERARATIAKAKGAAGKAASATAATTTGVDTKRGGSVDGASRQAHAVARQLVKAGGSGDAAAVKAVLKAAAELPLPVLQALHANGTKIVACRGGITDHANELRGVSPRGWPPGSSWDHVPGAYLSARNEVVVATSRDMSGATQVAGGHGSMHLVAHESGHALDYASRHESQGTEFQTAYTRDAVRGKMIPYLMQGGIAGAQEAYAESFASYVAGKDPGGQFDNQRVFWEGKYGKRK